MKKVLLTLAVAVLALGLVSQGHVQNNAYAAGNPELLPRSGIVYVSWYFRADTLSRSFPLDLSGIPVGPQPYAEVRFHVSNSSGSFYFRHSQTNIWGVGHADSLLSFVGWTPWMYARGGNDVDNIYLQAPAEVVIDKYEYKTYFAIPVPLDSMDVLR